MPDKLEGSTSQEAGKAPAPAPAPATVIEAGTGEAAFKKFDAYPWAKDRSFLVSHSFTRLHHHPRLSRSPPVQGPS